MSRVLSMNERRVEAVEREAYLAALPVRRAAASAVHAHFWVFEHATEHGRFVEFTEAASDDVLRAAHGHDAPTDSWREVEGG